MILVGAVSVVALSLASSAGAIVAYRISRHRVGEPATAKVLEADGDREARRRAEVDEAEPAPSTPSASKAARPAWAHDASGWAPQVARAVDVFADATPITAAVDHAFVICRFQSFGQADTFAGDDLRVHATFGTTPELIVNGPEDANLAFLSAPAVTMRPGDFVHFEVYDRDVFSDQLLSRTHRRFDGTLAATEAGAAYECRTLAPDAQTRLVKAAAASADDALVDLGARHLAATNASWGYPTAEIDHAEHATRGMAALTGWADARTAHRIARVSEELARLDGEKPAVFADLLAIATARARVGELDVRVSAIDCAGDRCTTHLTVKNTSTTELTLPNMLGPHAYVAAADTGPITATFDPVTLPPNAVVDVTLQSAGVRLGDRPSILGLCTVRTCAALSTR